MLWGKDFPFPHNFSQRLAKSKKNFSRQGAPEQARRRLTAVSQAACEEQRSIGEFFKDLLLLIFALLISNSARSLACRLAGGLALATTAVLSGLAKILGFDSLNTLHSIYPPINIDLWLHYITNFQTSQEVKEKFPNFSFSFFI